MRSGRLVVVAYVCVLVFAACTQILGITDVKMGAVETPDAHACMAGVACVPANQCHGGISTCDSSGNQSCIDTGTVKGDGTTCAGGMCMSGTCTDPCGTVSCDTPPASTCNGQVAKSFAVPGTCDSSTGAPVCSYAPLTMDCAAAGKICTAGTCTGIPDAPLPDAMPTVDGM